MCGYGNKSLGASSIMYPFSRIKIVGSLLGPVFCIDIGAQPNKRGRYGF